MPSKTAEKPTYVPIRLEPYEFALAANVGVRRQMAAVLTGRMDKYGIDHKLGWNVHIEGACGEMAVARFLGLYYSGHVNTFKVGGDVGILQVRTRSDHEYDLLIRPDDNENEMFMLVTGTAPEFRLQGWLWGHEARRTEWWQTHGDRAGAWFVPSKHLREPKLLIPTVVMPWQRAAEGDPGVE